MASAIRPAWGFAPSLPPVKLCSRLSVPETLNPYGTMQVPPKVEEVDGKWSVTEGGRTIEAYSLDHGLGGGARLLLLLSVRDYSH